MASNGTLVTFHQARIRGSAVEAARLSLCLRRAYGGVRESGTCASSKRTQSIESIGSTP